MPDLETPEQFAVNWCMHQDCSGGDKPDHCCAILTDAIRARDRQVREARDRDWILAMAAALGMGSGHHVPIISEPEPFRELFAAVRREALLAAADWLAGKVRDVSEVTRDCRREAVALKESGKEWQDAFHRECLSDARCGGFRDAEEHIRALATGAPDDR